MAIIKWDVSEKIPELRLLGMDRLVKAADIIRDEAKQILTNKIKGPPITHPPYQTGKYAGQIWTAREYMAMVKTIRVVTKTDSTERNVWIMAGNYKTWWALQMEYGHGDWRGGKKAFLRPAINKSLSKIRSFIQNG